MPAIKVDANAVANGLNESRGQKQNIPDTMLLSLPRLSVEMKRRGILSYGKRTYERWVTRGVQVEGRKKLLKLQSRRIGNVRHSTVGWVYEFLESQSK